MKLVDINKKVFEDYCKTNELDNFFQSKYYAELKRLDGYHTYFVGLEESGKIFAATMLLSKDINVLKKRIFYAPRGFILDYKNTELVNIFTKELVEYVQRKNGVLIKINPLVMLYDRDIEGKIIEGGTNNTKLVDSLKLAGWHQEKSELLYPVESNIIYNLHIKNRNEEELFDDFSEELKDLIKRNEKLGISVNELDKTDLNKFIDILQGSSELKDQLNLNYGNYQEIINILDNHNLLEIATAEIDIDKYLKYMLDLKDQILDDNQLEEINNKINLIKQLQYEYGHKVLVGVLLGVSYNKQYYVLTNATVDIFKDLNPMITVYWETIKKAKNIGCESYNFGEIDSSIDNKLITGFKCKNIELIGEFDYILNEKYYKKIMKQQKKAYH